MADDSLSTTHSQQPAGARPRRQSPWRALLPATGFYFAWTAIALVSHLSGGTILSPPVAALLLGGLVATNVLLVVMHLPAPRHGATAAMATAEAALAIGWTTVYAVLSDGAGELVPAMYLTALLLAFTRAEADRLPQLALAAGGGYALALLVRALAGQPTSAIWLQWLGLVVVLALLTWRAQYTQAERGALRTQVTWLQREVARLSRSAERDHLTRSFTRQYIMDALQREKARADRTGRGFSVCIFDLDRFKTLNDTHGHIVGDQVLAAFAGRARGALRAMDAINPTRYRRALGRLGGEEFLALLPGTDIAGALRSAERVRHAVASEPVGGNLQITVSAGVAEYRPGESVSELLTRADQAMYVAKRSGRNRVRVSLPPPDAKGDRRPARPSLRVVR